MIYTTSVGVGERVPPASRCNQVKFKYKEFHGESTAKLSREHGFENLFTVFVDGIPGMIDAHWLRFMFKQFGPVMDSFIPSKRRRNTSTRFGFVRFKYKSEAEKAIKEMNGAWRHGNKLRVRMADYGWSALRNNKNNGSDSERKERVIHTKPLSSSGSDGRTYREVLRNGVGSAMTMDAGLGLNFKGKSNQHMAHSYMNSPVADLGVNPGRNLGVDILLSQSAMKTVEEFASRVAFLESEVTRLQQALISAMSNGLLKKEVGKSSSIIGEQQLEEESGGEEGNASTIIEGQQMEVVFGGEVRYVRSSGEGNNSSIVTEATEIASELSIAMEVSVLSEATGSVREDVVLTHEKFDDGESAGSFTGDRGTAGSGEEGEIDIIKVINYGDVWDSKFEDEGQALGLNGGNLSGKKTCCLGQDVKVDDPNSIVLGNVSLERPSEYPTLERIDMDTNFGGLEEQDIRDRRIVRVFKLKKLRNMNKGNFLRKVHAKLKSRRFDHKDLDFQGMFSDDFDTNDSEDEEALEELEHYRQLFENFKARNLKDCSFSRMDNKPLSVEMEGDRKSCNSANSRKRTKGQKKKKVKSKRRNNAIFRWMGVKRRFAYVFSRRILAES